MTFALSSPDSAIGAVLNWVPGNAPVTIAAWGSSMNLLDQQRRKTKAPTNRHCVSRLVNAKVAWQAGAAMCNLFSVTMPPGFS
jgi:hypothetical protein